MKSAIGEVSECRRVWVCKRCGNCSDHCKHNDETNFHEDLSMPCSAVLVNIPEPSKTEQPPEREFDHFSIVPFKAICGADIPNQSTTQIPERAKCATCWFYWKEFASSRTFAAAPSQQWQPIETAPKNGTGLLLWSPEQGHVYGYWQNEHGSIGWAFAHGTGLLWPTAMPTHWMPLPTAPALTTTPRECEWKSSCDPDFDVWETSCGELFQFEADGPTENKMKFCCYCGKVLIAIVSRDSEPK